MHELAHLQTGAHAQSGQRQQGLHVVGPRLDDGAEPGAAEQLLADMTVDVAGMAEHERAMFQRRKVAPRDALLGVLRRARDHVHPQGSRHDEPHLLLIEIEQLHAGQCTREMRDGKIHFAVN